MNPSCKIAEYTKYHLGRTSVQVVGNRFLAETHTDILEAMRTSAEVTRPVAACENRGICLIADYSEAAYGTVKVLLSNLRPMGQEASQVGVGNPVYLMICALSPKRSSDKWAWMGSYYLNSMINSRALGNGALPAEPTRFPWVAGCFYHEAEQLTEAERQVFLEYSRPVGTVMLEEALKTYLRVHDTVPEFMRDPAKG